MYPVEMTVKAIRMTRQPTIKLFIAPSVTKINMTAITEYPAALRNRCQSGNPVSNLKAALYGQTTIRHVKYIKVKMCMICHTP